MADGTFRDGDRLAAYTLANGNNTDFIQKVAVVDSVGGMLNSASSGITASASFTPTATAYSALDIMDVAKQFNFTYSDGTAVRTGSLIRILTAVIKIDATALQASEGAYTLQCFSVTPPSALADNAAWTLASGDLPSYRGSISLGTPADIGSALYIKTPGVDTDINLTTTSMFCQLQTIAGFTPTAVARQVFLYGIAL